MKADLVALGYVHFTIAVWCSESEEVKRLKIIGNKVGQEKDGKVTVSYQCPYTFEEKLIVLEV